MVITIEEMHKIVREVLLERKVNEKKKEQSVKHKKYSGKEYTASAGSVASIKKHGGSVEKAVKSGDFDWADDPYAAAQAAHIVAMGQPTVKKGEKKKK